MKTFALDSEQLLELNLLKKSTWNLFSRLFLSLLGERIGKWSYLPTPVYKGKESRLSGYRDNLSKAISGFETEWQQARKDSRPPEVDVPKALEEVSLMPALDTCP